MEKIWPNFLIISAAGVYSGLFVYEAMCKNPVGAALSFGTALSIILIYFMPNERKKS